MALCLLRSAYVGAQTNVTAAATGQYQFNSNVFDVQSGYPVPGSTSPARGDGYIAYGSDLALDYLWSHQKLSAVVSGTQYDYQRFTQLNHSEYLLDGGWTWSLGNAVDGDFEVLRNRQMLAFSEVVSADLTNVTEQRESAKIAAMVTPNWRLDGSGYRTTIWEPLPGTPHLELTQFQGQGGLAYVANASLTAGADVSYLSSHFSGGAAGDDPDFHQTSESLLINYREVGKSTLSFGAGYSRQISASATDSVSGVTGKLEYQNQLSGKTEVDVSVSRAITAYITNLAAELDTSAAFSIDWLPTYQTRVQVGYTWLHRSLPDQGLVSGTNRTDDLQFVSLRAHYQALRWLVLSPYASFQTRGSDYPGANFNATVYGMSLEVYWQNVDDASVPEKLFRISAP